MVIWVSLMEERAHGRIRSEEEQDRFRRGEGESVDGGEMTGVKRHAPIFKHCVPTTATLERLNDGGTWVRTECRVPICFPRRR